MMLVTPMVAFGFSTPDIVLIMVVALLLFGPKNLPKMARTIGKSMEEFRRAAREIENEIMKEPEPTTPPPPPELNPAPTSAPAAAEPGMEPETTPVAQEQEPTAEIPAAVVMAENPVPAAAPPATVTASTENTAPAAVTPSTTPAAAPAQPPVEKTPDVKPAA